MIFQEYLKIPKNPRNRVYWRCKGDVSQMNEQHKEMMPKYADEVENTHSLMFNHLSLQMSKAG